MTSRAVRLAVLAGWWLFASAAAPTPAPPDIGWLGISIAEVGEDLAERLGAAFGPTAGTGVQIVDVLKDGPAETAGLDRGDVIVQLDAQPIWDVRQLQRTVRAQPVSRGVVLVVLRGTSRVRVPITIGAMPPVARAQIAGERFGFVVREIPEPDPAGGGPATASRVAVAYVDPNSAAGRGGLQPMDTVVRVNDRPVRDLEAFAAALWPTADAVTLTVERRGAPAPIAVTLSARP